MELGIKKKQKNKNKKTLHTPLTGFISFLIALISLAGLNIALLIKTDTFPGIFLYQLPFLGLFLGGFGLFTVRRSRFYAWWGIGLNAFILIFTFMMFLLAWTINPKP